MAPSHSTAADTPASWFTQALLSASRMRALAVAVALLLVLALQASLAPTLNAWNDRLTSRSWSWADSTNQERRIVVIDIDEKSVQALGTWPWPRERVAQLLQALDQQGVGLKIVDILFDGPQAQDPALAQALQSGAPSVIAQLFALHPQHNVQTGTLTGALSAMGATGPGSCPPGTPIAHGYMAPTASLLSAGQGVGHITPVVDPDGTIRRVPALICHQGQTYPALVVSALAAATGAQPQWRPQSGLSGAAQTLQVGSFQLPTDAQGQLLVSYQTPRSGFIALSASDVLAGRVPAQLLQGAWALIGSTAMGAGDAVPTPQGGAVGGIEVHAQLLAAALDERTPYVPQWASYWPWASGAVSALLLLWALRLPRPGAAVTVPAVALACALAVWGVHTTMLLAHHQVLAWGTPLLFIALLATSLLVAEMLRVRFERERLYQNLASYLPEGAARKVALSGPTAQVIAQRQEATVMFVDLRNFSAYCEGRSPEESATVLHLFYTTVDRIVDQHGGVVEQMVGDAIMAVWNGSSPCPNHAQKAVGAAEEIWREGVAQLPKVASRQTPPLDLGLGIETGDIMIGSFGPAQRRVHSVLGETVTIASRLEKLTAELAYPILLGPEVVRQAQPPKAQALGDFLLDGLTQSRKIHSLPVQYGPSHLQLVYSADQDQALVG
uniref:CHASE2 domain-containing protein n=1 Tax=Limnohabitans sp. TaxID=1907725 RepID=UPI004047C7B4